MTDELKKDAEATTSTAVEASSNENDEVVKAANDLVDAFNNGMRKLFN